MDPRVGVYRDARLSAYDVPPPFHPARGFPEYPYGHNSESNSVYDGVRSLFRLLGLDAAHYGTRDWSPLSGIINPGDRVVVKPNWVLHCHRRGGSLDCIITHGSVVRAVVDFVLIALRGKGTVTIGDAPLQSAEFCELQRASGMEEVAAYYRLHAGVPVQVVDFRRERAVSDCDGVLVRHDAVRGDPAGYSVVNLEERSLLAGVDAGCHRLRVPNYDPQVMRAHHNNRKHEYLIAGSVLAADVVISIPKLKTHCKAGITCCLKNLVGINGSKDWLPHHRRGSSARGGDEYLSPSLLKSVFAEISEYQDATRAAPMRRLAQFARALLHYAIRLTAKDQCHEGGWFGNDTIWRTVVDLNRALLYATPEGALRDAPQRQTFFVVDGIVAGEGEGPLAATRKPCGLLLGGFAAPAVDAVAARIMGFDFRRIPLIREAFKVTDLPLSDFGPDKIQIRCNDPDFDGIQITQPGPSLAFEPASGWRGNIELRAPGTSGCRENGSSGRDC